MNLYDAPDPASADDTEPTSALTRLRSALALVEQMAEGEGGLPGSDAYLDQQLLDDGATLAIGYANASSIAQRRFDALASEAAAFAAAGIDALIRHKQRSGRECSAGARELADEMNRSIAAMSRIIREGADSRF